MATSAGFFICANPASEFKPMLPFILTADALRSALEHDPVPPSAVKCACSTVAGAGWESISEDRWPSEQMLQVASLRDPGVEEPTFEEYHPDGTRYDAPDAPIAVAFFPYNRCDLWQCQTCRRHVLRYTEFGGYYVDHRVRAARSALIVD